MRSYILRHDGSYAVETINSSVVWSKNHYQTKNKTYHQLEEQHHLKSEHDWIMAHGRGSLWMCAIPINSVVINALQKMTGDLCRSRLPRIFCIYAEENLGRESGSVSGAA